MTKTEIIECMAAEAGISQAAADRALKAFLNTIERSLAKGAPVSLVGFGTFVVSRRAERQGRNPKTGEPVNIPAAKVAKFRPGKGLKELLNP